MKNASTYVPTSLLGWDIAESYMETGPKLDCILTLLFSIKYAFPSINSSDAEDGIFLLANILVCAWIDDNFRRPFQWLLIQLGVP